MLVRKFILLLIPYYLIVGSVNYANYTVFALLPAMLLLINSCTIDMQHNNQKWLVSLPVPRHQLVLAKYLGILPYGLFSFACTLLLYLISFWSGRTAEPLAWRELALSIGCFPLLAAVYLPLYYWLGRKGTQVVNFIFIMLIMLQFSAMSKLLEWFPGLASWAGTGRTDSLLLPVIAGLAYVLILFCSYLVSLKIFTRKDI
ncbi:ABC-2 family transporter protein [compost metagenome]